jgi:hypothetical protein
MTCKEVERLLAEDISQGHDALALDHIERCSVCQRLHRELTSMSELSRLLGGGDRAPADFSSRVHERLAKLSLWQLQWKPALALSLGLLGLVGFLWIQEVQPGTDAQFVTETTPQEESFARVQDGDPQLIDADRVEGPVEGPYVDVILKSPSEPEYILRLPSRIKVRTSDLNSDIYLNNASY